MVLENQIIRVVLRGQMQVVETEDLVEEVREEEIKFSTQHLAVTGNKTISVIHLPLYLKNSSLFNSSAGFFYQLNPLCTIVLIQTKHLHVARHVD